MGPLNNLRIIELDGLGPVPLCAMVLADLGAEVIRVSRASGQSAYEDVGGSILHRGRKDLTLDLKSEIDRAALLDLIENADVLLEGFRPGVMERLGLGPDICLARNPRLIFSRMTGFGQYGDMAPRAGHDINYIAVSGALAAMGAKSEIPPVPLNLVGDYGGGAMFLALGVLAAVIEARASGKGQVVDVAMTDAVPLLMSLFSALNQNGNWSFERESNLLDGGMPFYRCYQCKDGGYVAVGALEPQFFAQLLDGLGLDAADFKQYDKTRHPEMKAIFTEKFLTKGRDDWADIFAGRDACVSPVLNMQEAAAHPHNVARSTHQRIDGVTHPSPAPRFARTPGEIRVSQKITVEELLADWKR